MLKCDRYVLKFRWYFGSVCIIKSTHQSRSNHLPRANNSRAIKEKAESRARELLDIVGLDERAFNRYPHEFSGGQRQRIGIARALALDPEILVADEPVSALDVSIQAQILELLDQIRESMNLSMVFITHDLRVAAQVCDRLAVMRYGEIVETGATGKIFENPQHSYTKDLLAAVPGQKWDRKVAG